MVKSSTSASVVSASSFKLWFLRKIFGDFLDRHIRGIFGNGRTVDALKVSHRQDTFHDCGVGGKRHVVLVHTPEL